MQLRQIILSMKPFFLCSDAESDRQVKTLLDKLEPLFPIFARQAAHNVRAHPMFSATTQLRMNLRDIMDKELMLAYSLRAISLFQVVCDETNNPPESCKDKIKMSVFIAPRESTGFVFVGEYETPLPAMYLECKHTVNGKEVNVKRLFT